MKNLLRFAPLLFYPVAFALWALASLGLMAGVDINKFLGLLGVIAWSIYGLFILGSAVVHLLPAARCPLFDAHWRLTPVR